ncbi:MAG: inositol monophosphatase family protein [Anaerolineae bacterium]|nr:inositol monophosphatase family protein [Anaerolineae bacterium]
MTDVQQLLDFALECAWKAGRISLGHFLNGVAVERKADNSPVTVADREVEQMLRSRITQQWPEHGIIGEEFGRIESRSEFTWIVDPIDGTKSFTCGVPFYANLIALTDSQGPLIGVAHYPALNEMIYAARGLGCYWNGRRCHVSDVHKLEDAVLLTSDVSSYHTPARAAIWDQLTDRTYFQRTWGDAYGYLLVATGRAEIMLEPSLAVWDAGPMPVIMNEAGGHFSDWQGQVDIASGSAVATNGELYEPVMHIIQESQAQGT